MLTTLLQRRASLENPSTSLADADAWAVDGMGGPASSGVTVNADTAMTYAPLWRGVNLISRDVAKLPFYVFRREGEKGKHRDPMHAAYRMVRHKANAYMTAFQFKQATTGRAILKGNGYAYIWRRGGAPRELLPLPDNTYPVRENGVLWYVTEVAGEKRKLPAADVLHIRGFGDGVMGLSLVEYARDSLGLGMAAHRHTAKFFANGARPGVVLETEKQLSPEARKQLKVSWDRMHKGLDAAHRTAVLEEGLKAHVLTMNARDMQWLETRQFEVREVANWLGVPPHKLGDPARTSHNSLEQENQSYLNDAVDPWLVTWESECWDKLLTRPQQDRDTHFFEFERKALVRADLAARTESYAKSVTHGWMTRNEVRAAENMNPLDGLDDILVPQNVSVLKDGKLIPVNDPETDTGAGEDDATPPAEEEQNAVTVTAEVRDNAPAVAMDTDHGQLERMAACRDLLRDTARRMATLVGQRARRASKRRDKLEEWMNDADAQCREVVTEAFAPVARVVAATSDLGVTAEDATDELMGEVKGILAACLDADDPDLAVMVDDEMSKLATHFPEALAVSYFGENSNG